MREAGSIVWSLTFWLGKDILGFVKNIDLDNSYGVAKMIQFIWTIRDTILSKNENLSQIANL